jgi:hypothetical protein
MKEGKVDVIEETYQTLISIKKHVEEKHPERKCFMNLQLSTLS